MNLQELRYLVAVAQHKHFGRAAEFCNVSQPTLSGQIRKLEDELGVVLLERAQSFPPAPVRQHDLEPQHLLARIAISEHADAARMSWSTSRGARDAASAGVAAIAGFLFGYDEGVIAVAEPLLAKDYPMSPAVNLADAVIASAVVAGLSLDLEESFAAGRVVSE